MGFRLPTPVVRGPCDPYPRPARRHLSHVGANLGLGFAQNQLFPTGRPAVPAARTGTLMTRFLDLEGYRTARERIAGFVHRTPVLTSRALGARVGVPLLLKCENLQKTGSFKVRGALNSVATLSEEAREKGVVTISAGNHAQAVAWAASARGARSTVVMPATASPLKAEATRGYGGEVILHGTAAEAFHEAFRIAEDRGMTFLHPFDSEPVVAGHGSTGLEIAEDMATDEGGGAFDVVVPVGGGGQISGVAGALTCALGSSVRIFGVEPEGADAMSRSLAAGTPVTLDSIDTAADGLAAPMAGALNLEYVQRYVEDVVRVSDEEIFRAMALLLQRVKVLVEPSGAAAVAALLAGRIPVRSGRPVVAILSGGNVDPPGIRRALEDPVWL